MNFDNCFQKDVLSTKFSNASVLLSDSFTDHFKEVLTTYEFLHKQRIIDNKFYYRIKTGLIRASDLVVISLPLENISFILEDFFSYHTRKRYDFIQVSNIPDWLKSENNVKLFVAHIKQLCTSRCNVLWRSLNGNYNLVKFVERHFFITRHFLDETFFYKQCFMSTVLQVDPSLYTSSSRIARHIFFKHLDKMPLCDFTRRQIPFFYAVRHWVHILTNVAQKLEQQPKLRLLLQENIDDERGNVPDEAHTNTFLQLLNALGAKELFNASYVQSFNLHLDDMVEHKSLAYTCAFLAMIEYQYIFISTQLKDYLDASNISQTHYAFHEVIDDKHARDLMYIAQTVLGSTKTTLRLAFTDSVVTFENLYVQMYFA